MDRGMDRGRDREIKGGRDVRTRKEHLAFTYIQFIHVAYVCI